MFRQLLHCEICPRRCGTNRYASVGTCGAGAEIVVAKAFLHQWEEPCISGTLGSGTVFFTHCNLRCLYCQNYVVSHQGVGKAVTIERLADIFLELQGKGAHNINLVTPTPYTPQVAAAIVRARQQGLRVPVVHNNGGYESVVTLHQLDGLVDIYLPDLKYCDSHLSGRWSGAPDYFARATEAVLEMFRQVGAPVFDGDGMLQRGLMIRHLTLPGASLDSRRIVDWVLETLPTDVYLNLMSQYTPLGRAAEDADLAAGVPREQYEMLIEYAIGRGLQNGYIQEMDSASAEYVPLFDLEGV